MMQQHLDELLSGVQSIDDGIKRLKVTLDALLSMPDKSFTITFKKKCYDFYVPTTHDEVILMYKVRTDFIYALLVSVISRNVKKSKHGWNDILSFARGPDPKDFQIEKIDLSELYEVADENGKKITSLPLNNDSTYVKMQDARNDKKNNKLVKE